MKEIQLTKGAVALIDDDDFERVSQYKWAFNSTLKYAFGSYKTKRGARGYQYLHRFIMGEPKGKIIDHINGDGLDCRKSNMRAVGKSENGLNRFKLDSRNKSGTTGVHYLKAKEKWEATIVVHGQKTIFGRFARKEDAIAARLNGERDLNIRPNI